MADVTTPEDTLKAFNLDKENKQKEANKKANAELEHANVAANNAAANVPGVNALNIKNDAELETVKNIRDELRSIQYAQRSYATPGKVIDHSASFSPDALPAKTVIDIIMLLSGLEGLLGFLEGLRLAKENNINSEHYLTLGINGAISRYTNYIEQQRSKPEGAAERDLGAENAASQRPAPTPAPKPGK